MDRIGVMIALGQWVELGAIAAGGVLLGGAILAVMTRRAARRERQHETR